MYTRNLRTANDHGISLACQKAIASAPLICASKPGSHPPWCEGGIRHWHTHPQLSLVKPSLTKKTYLAEFLLEQSGIALFDAWARTFAEVVPIFEMTPDGGGFRINIRLARFVNLPELFSIWYQFTFSQSGAAEPANT